MAIIPVETKKALKFLNLPDKPKFNDLVDAHKNSVISRLKLYSDELAFNQAILENPTPEPSQELTIAFESAYNRLLLVEIMPFLNLNTAGDGIAKKTGIDENAVELLTGREIEAEQKRLTKQALQDLGGYLSPAGRQLLTSLTGNLRRGFRASII